jgi:type 1 glutamine amidotransferase
VPGNLKAAVITEWHPFDVIGFQRLFTSFDDFEVFPQAFEIFAKDERNSEYDIVVYYNMSFPAPDEQDPRRTYLEQKLGSTNQGIVLLHHGILSYAEWSFWDGVSGTRDRNFKYYPNQTVRYDIVNPEGHPITRGLGNFTLVDESYTMAEPTVDNEILVTADHPNSMRAIAWTRQYKSSRVFCYQSGHDDLTWSDQNFRNLLHRGMLWSAGRLG